MPEKPYTAARGALRRWRETRRLHGAWRATRELAADVWEFLRESTPERRRARYGDLDHDFETGLDTTAANVGSGTRLRAAVAGAPYQPVDPAVFRESMAALAIADIAHAQFTFVDVGSGKGRALLLAAEYPFRRIVGVELLPELHAVAEENIRKFRAQRPEAPPIESGCGDARDFPLPAGPLVLYLFNPLPEAALAAFVGRVERSVREAPRPVFALYHNPLLAHVFAGWERVAGTHQWALYRAP